MVRVGEVTEETFRLCELLGSLLVQFICNISQLMNTDAVQSVNVASLHAGILPDGQYANWRTGLQPNIENINNYYHSKHVMHLVCSLSCCLH